MDHQGPDKTVVLYTIKRETHFLSEDERVMYRGDLESGEIVAKIVKDRGQWNVTFTENYECYMSMPSDWPKGETCCFRRAGEEYYWAGEHQLTDSHGYTIATFARVSAWKKVGRLNVFRNGGKLLEFVIATLMAMQLFSQERKKELNRLKKLEEAKREKEEAKRESERQLARCRSGPYAWRY